MVTSLAPTVDHLFAVLREKHPNAHFADALRAYEMAEVAHRGQLRKSGEPFIVHPLGVALICAEMGMDTTTIIAALLHDAVEDTSVSVEDVVTEFGPETAAIVDGLTKISKIGFRTAEQAQAENYRKMIVAMATDVRVIIVKLADRLHNLRTLEALRPEKQALKAAETLEIYVPLANRLGMSRVKAELEDLSFQYRYPKRYQEVVDLTDRRQADRADYVDHVIEEIKRHLEHARIPAQVHGRAKNYYSIYQKMVERGVEFDDIYDLVGLRIVVNDQHECYTALGVVHAIWTPMQGRFKDYIAMPKFNLYQSLHTTVMGPEGKALEIQIRTHAMHRVAEFGVAAHWRYKEGGGREDTAWIGEMAEVNRESSDPREFMDTLRLDLFHDEIFCFTPKGDVQCLPRGATPLDFAYAIHTEVGHRTIGAKINGRLVPLDTRLESEDVVEVLTTRSPDAHPKRDWLSIAKTSRARSKIRAWFAAHRREEAREAGREMFLKVLKRESLTTSQLGDDEWRALLSDTKQSSATVLYEMLGDNKISAEALASALRRIFKPEAAEEPAAEPERPAIRRTRKPEATQAIVPGAEDVLVKLAGCCMPVPGDQILGFITRGKGVSVHRLDCPNARVLAAQSERIVDVQWDTSQGGTFSVVLQVESIDRVGLLRDITNTLSDLGVLILSSSTRAQKDGTSRMRFGFELGDVMHLNEILRRVRVVDGVFDVYRVLPLESRRS